MEINSEYLKEFCEVHGVFSNGYMTAKPKAVINYYFGVPLKKLNECKIKDINQLEDTIKKFGIEPPEADKDLNRDLEEISNIIL